jgi:hypothetical protein
VNASKALELHTMANEAMRVIRNVLLTYDAPADEALLYEKAERVKYLIDEILAETLPDDR